VKKPPKPASAVGAVEPAVAPSVDRLLAGILAFFLCLAVALRPLLPGHRHEANLWVEMCAFVAALAGVVRAAIARRVRLERTGMGLPTLALLAVAAISTIRSPHPLESVATLLEWLAYAAAFAITVQVTRADNGLDARLLLRVLWASAFVAILYGLFQQFVNLPLLAGMIATDSGRVLSELRMSERHIGDLMARATGRIFSTFLLSNSFAGFLALVFPGFLGYVLDRVRGGERGRWFLGVAAFWLAAALACLVLTYSKGGWVAFAVGMAAFALMLGRALLRRHARLVAGVVAAAAAAFALLLATKVVPVQIFRDFVTSFDIRVGYWQGALSMARDHPVGGVGLGTFGDRYPRYRPLLAHPAQDTHNDYLQVLAELGVPGLLAFLWLWAACLRNAFAGPAPAPEHHARRPFPARLACWAAVVAFVLTTIVMTTFSLAGWWDESPASRELKVWLDRALVTAFVACWLVFFAALGRGEPRPPGELCHKGLVCGLIAFLVHCAVDFDYQEPGVAFTAWVVAALCVRPRRPAIERRLGLPVAIALPACGLLLVAAFQFVLFYATRSATERDTAASLLTDTTRTLSPLERAELIHGARQHYEEAARTNPLDDSLRLEYGDLLVSLLAPQTPGGAPPGEQGAGAPGLRLRIERPDDLALFQHAVALYTRAAELNHWGAAARIRLGGLCMAAARPDAGPLAAAALRPLVEAAAARRTPTGPHQAYLPAVAAFEDALARDPNNPAVLLLVAEAREKLGDPTAADVARRALDIATRLGAVHLGHKLCLKYEEVLRAQGILRRAEREGPPP